MGLVHGRKFHDKESDGLDSVIPLRVRKVLYFFTRSVNVMQKREGLLDCIHLPYVPCHQVWQWPMKFLQNQGSTCAKGKDKAKLGIHIVRLALALISYSVAIELLLCIILWLGQARLAGH